MKVLRGKNYFLYVLLVFNIFAGLALFYFQDQYFNRPSMDYLEPPQSGLGLRGVIKLETIVTNLLPTGNLKRYVRIAPVLILGQDEVLDEVKLKDTLIRDKIISYLNTSSEREILSPEGMSMLKEKIKEIINKILDRNKVSMVYFREFRVN